MIDYRCTNVVILSFETEYIVEVESQCEAAR